MKQPLVLLIIFALTFFASCQQQSAKVEKLAGIKQISVEQAKTAVESGHVQFVDVRTDAEFKGEHAPNAFNLPLDALEQNLTKLDKEKPVYFICETGRRSKIAAEILIKNEFKEIYDITGGMSAWRKAGLPTEN
jgi:rhodanese-related sulfurtransferase